ERPAGNSCWSGPSHPSGLPGRSAATPRAVGQLALRSAPSTCSPHDPGQLVPGDQQLLAGGLLPEPLQDPSADQHARKLPARLGEPPQRSQGIRGDAHAVDLRPATWRPAVRDEPRRVISGSPPLKLLLGPRDGLLLSPPGHCPALPSTLPATCGPRQSRCRLARPRRVDARSCRSTPAAPAAPSASSPAPPPTPGRCPGVPAGSGPGPPRWPTAAQC